MVACKMPRLHNHVLHFCSRCRDLSRHSRTHQHFLHILRTLLSIILLVVSSDTNCCPDTLSRHLGMIERSLWKIKLYVVNISVSVSVLFISRVRYIRCKTQKVASIKYNTSNQFTNSRIQNEEIIYFFTS